MKIYELLIEAGREEHIARHHITIAEVEQVVLGETAFIRRTRDERYLVIGQTDAGRYVSVILAPRSKGAYALNRPLCTAGIILQKIRVKTGRKRT